MYTQLKQRRMRWLGHVVRMDAGRIPKDLLYGELAQGKRPRGRPQLRYKDVCKRDIKALSIDQNTWEAIALERSTWRRTVRSGLSLFEDSLSQLQEERRARRKATTAQPYKEVSKFICAICHRDCHSRNGLISHSRRCNRVHQT